MPMYEYACRDCEHSFEILLQFSQADQPQTCPTCGSLKTARALSTFAVSGGSAKAAPVAARPSSSPFT